MKIEKLNENKIRVVFNNKDLEENNIDFHSFMSNSIETQALFLNLLDEAEKKLGFITDNCKIAVETLSLNNSYFVLTITRMAKASAYSLKKRVHTNIKLNKTSSPFSIYKFNSFEDFCDFCNNLYLQSPEFIIEFENINSLYSYKNNYFFVINTLNLSKELLDKLILKLTEFSTFVENSLAFFNKLNEFGDLIIENNAITTCIPNY